MQNNNILLVNFAIKGGNNDFYTAGYAENTASP